MPLQFYYPMQTRGVNSAGNPESFAMCGLIEGGGQAHTVCGSLSQVNSGFYLSGGQTDKGSSNWADPLDFGTANKPALVLTPVDKCTTANTTVTTANTTNLVYDQSSHGLRRTAPLAGLALVLALLAGAA